MDELFTLDEAARFLRLSNRALRDLCKRRGIAYVRVNRTPQPLASADTLAESAQLLRPKKPTTEAGATTKVSIGQLRANYEMQ